MRKCDSCGKPYQETKDVFCPHCGAVAQKHCTHGSSFDIKRYDRGELYENNNKQYQNTTYNKGFEPHAQRQNNPYNPQKNADYGNKNPQINLPDLKKVLSKGNGKPIGIIVFGVIIAFNFITGLISSSDDVSFSSNNENVSVQEDYINDFYTVVDKATIEMVNTDGDFKTFTLEISSMAFDDYISESMKDNISSGAMMEEILSENTFVEMRFCDFSTGIVSGDSYNNAIDDSYNYSGKQTDSKCKYEFSYSFDYDEIVHIASGVDFHLGNGQYINAELPFSAFSLSENGKITYYTSYADDTTEWNTVFSECSNEQEINKELCVDFDSVVTVEGE